MPKRSRYDDIHDQYLPDAGRKAGTRYERLMAVVQAGLNAANAVVHDSRLRGNISGEPHQIDVLIEDQAGRRRVLIECKDFDVRGSAVGIGIVRDFHGVVTDVQPDEAWIVSCNGFTKPARRWAKAFGIKLATLREFRETDWEGRLRTIVVDFRVRGSHGLSLTFESSAPELAPLIGQALGSMLAPVGPGAVGGHPRDITINVTYAGLQMSFEDFTNEQIVKSLRVLDVPVGEREEHLVFKDLVFGVDGALVPIEGIRAKYQVTETRTELRIEAPGIAVLLLSRTDGDVVVFDVDIRKYTIDATGAVRRIG